jgi:hypothetical protein
VKRLVGGAQGALALLGSMRLACALLVLLGLLTWLGTLEQVEHGLYSVQREYFESLFLVHEVHGVPVPLPGAALVLALLFVNLLVGGMLRLRRGWATAGILVAHLGIALLLVAGFVKLAFSKDGHVTLFESERADWFQSWFRWELALARRLPDGRVEEWLVPEEDFLDAGGAGTVTLSSASLPFDLEVAHVLANCRPLPAGALLAADAPAADGWCLRAEPLATEAESNVAGLLARVLPKSGEPAREGLLWGLARGPWTVDVGGETWGLELRKERYPLPFTLVLDDFTKVDHPRSSMPKSFASDLTVVEGGSERRVEISMNEPLREAGLVLYQASWGPASAGPNDPLFSTFAVVENPADRVPLVGCVVSAIGLVWHFSRRLGRHVRAQGRRS